MAVRKPRPESLAWVIPDAAEDQTDAPPPAPGEPTFTLLDYRALVGRGPGEGVFGVSRIGPNENTGRPEDSVGFEEDIQARGWSNVGFRGRDLYETWGEYAEGFIGQVAVHDCGGVAWLQYAAHSNPAVEEAWLAGPLSNRSLLGLLADIVTAAESGVDGYPSLQPLCQAILAHLNLDNDFLVALQEEGPKGGQKLTQQGRDQLARVLTPVQGRTPM